MRHACRAFVRSPGFTFVVVLTLSLGIGATTSIFSFVRGVLLEPLPFTRPDRLVMVCETSQERPADWCTASPANWADWVRRSRTIESFGLGRDWTFWIKDGERLRAVHGGVATPGLFQTLAVQPVLGRVFEPGDLLKGSPRIAVISHHFWQSRLGAARDVLGRTLEIDGEPHAIAGVLPDGFEVPYTEEADVWIPLWPERADERGWRGFSSFGRLKDGASLDQARAEMDSIRAALAGEHPETNAAWGVRVDPLSDRIVRGTRNMLLIFLAASVLVLLIGCANVANLFLARAAERRREFAVRLALGAGRTRLAVQILQEGILYALAGGLVGVVGAFWAVDLFKALGPRLPRLEVVHVDGGVLAFSVVLSAAVSVLFGLAPALDAARLSLVEDLRDARGNTDAPGSARLRDLLVVAELGLACMLLVGAGLLLRSFRNLLDWRPGFDPSKVAFVQVFSPQGRYDTPESKVDLFRRCVREMSAVPLVAAAGAGSALPLYGGDGEQEFLVEGRPVPPPGQRPFVWWFDVDPDYFATLGIPLHRGRFFTDADRLGTPDVAIVNETMARLAFSSDEPIGARLHLVVHQKTVEIVGVVTDVHPFRPDESPRPEIYWPFAQQPRGAIVLVARLAGPPAAVLPAIRERLQTIDPDLDVGPLRTLDDRIAGRLSAPRFNMMLGGLFAVLAAAIALTGVYGVVSFAVARRTREIGVRIALGARPRSIAGMVLERGLWLAVSGLALGLLGALAMTRLLRSLLVGVEPADPATFAGVAVALLAVALVAVWAPARRAAGLDPVTALRHE
jgi:putative ABC transport system permease protein